MKLIKSSILSFILLLLINQQAFSYESFSHTTLLLPVEPINSEPWIQQINSQQDWETFFNSTISRVSYLVGEAPEVPVLDFDNYLLITGGLGMKPSGGYSIAVEKVVETSDFMNIHFLITSPGENCTVFSAITYPTVTFLVKKTTKEISYSITSAVDQCN